VKISETFEIAGKTVTLECGEVAHAAHGAVVVRCGEAMLLGTVVADWGRVETKAGEDFVPLTVEYRERMSSVGKIPGGYLKRETRLGDYEVLTSRLIDRAVRPLFPSGFAHEVQVLVTVYGAEADSDLEVLAVTAASAALAVSDIPWGGPVAGLRARGEGGLDIVGAADANGLVMLEGGSAELGREVVMASLEAGIEAAKAGLDAISRLAATVGKGKGGFVPAVVESKSGRNEALAGRRRDGRGLTDVRPVSASVGYLPSNDGSALFSRGETQALVSVTLGQADEGPSHETVFGKKFERFFLHYNFPSFSVGEVKQNRGPGRREIGHGALARRALLGVLPADDAMNYSVRVVSDILTSNGSSSMATVCGASLALMDAGVPIKAAVAGVAIGLVRDGDKSALLVDITGGEDNLGDMDFKVAGTRAGLTAVQLDIKGKSIDLGIIASALDAANGAIGTILDAMDQVLAEPRAEMKKGAPQVINMRVPERRIGLLIGPGGRTINEIQSATGTRIDVKDDGRVKIVGKRAADVKAAQERISALTIELKVGERYEAEVVTLKEYGVFVRIADHEGLVHISELAPNRVEKVEDVVALGEVITVKVLGADEKGRLKMSRKAAL
jgi:polyribonucleotide nucleotidyltransferase